MPFLLITLTSISKIEYNENSCNPSSIFAINIKSADGTQNITDVNPNTTYRLIVKGPLSGNIGYCVISNTNFTVNGSGCTDAYNGTAIFSITTTIHGETIVGAVAPMACSAPYEALPEFAVNFNWS